MEKNSNNWLGQVGSGKSTLARKLALKLNLPYYEIDNMVWRRDKGQDIRNSDLERDTLLQNIICSDAWIIEGVHNEDWVFQSIHQADVIIFLDPTYRTRTYRIIKRFIFQKIGMEQSNYKPTFKIFFKMFSWNRMFEDRKTDIIDKIREYNNNLLILKDKVEVDYFYSLLDKENSKNE